MSLPQPFTVHPAPSPLRAGFSPTAVVNRFYHPQEIKVIQLILSQTQALCPPFPLLPGADRAKGTEQLSLPDWPDVSALG